MSTLPYVLLRLFVEGLADPLVQLKFGRSLNSCRSFEKTHSFSFQRGSENLLMLRLRRHSRTVVRENRLTTSTPH